MWKVTALDYCEEWPEEDVIYYVTNAWPILDKYSSRMVPLISLVYERLNK